jgi:regulator of RNase E activity RraA
VLVIDARGDGGAGVLGDVLAARMAYRGAAALVTDGAVRDLPAMQEVELPIYSRHVHAATFGELHMPVDLNVAIQCAGVTILPGDILVGDEEGVCVVPPAVAAKLADAAGEQELRDRFTLAKIAAGEPLREAFPPSERLRVEYEEWRRGQE